MIMDIDNRRKYQRIDFDGEVDLEFADHVYHCCQIKDLSLTGMFVQGDINQHPSGNCIVKIFHKEKNGDNCMIASGEVVWRNEEGIGLKFTDMTLENYTLLQTTLSKKAEQPAIILQEFPHNYPFEINGI